VQIVRVVITVPPGQTASQADAELVNDLLWSHCQPNAGVAHITTIALPDRIDVTIFLNSGTENPARRVMTLLGSIPGNSILPGYWLDNTER
jgi:hypothetical protein